MTGNTISLFEEVEWKRIVFDTSDNKHACHSTRSISAETSIDVSIWFGPDAGRLYLDDVGIKRNYIHSLIHFKEETRRWRIDLTRHFDRRSFRHKLCGWSTISESLQSQLAPTFSNNRDTDDTTVRVVLAPLQDSLTEICVQDLFLAILSPLVAMLVPGETVILESGGHVLLQNSTVTAITNILVDNGLATRFGALSCAVSLLAPRLHPDPDTLLSGLTEKADTYRRNAEWDRAQTLLQWACVRYSEKSIKSDTFTASTDALRRFLTVLQATGELYRWSCAKNFDRKTREFGFKGIKWMLANFNHLSTQSPDIREVLDNYEYVANRIEHSFMDNLPYYILQINSPRRNNPLLSAIRDGHKKIILSYLCLTHTGDFNSHYLCPALPLATRNGWTEVIDAILEMKGHVDNRDNDGRTSISYCAEYGNLSLLHRFINLGASVNIQDHRGRSPLLHAIYSKQEAAAKALLQTGLIEEDKFGTSIRSALFFAIDNDLSDLFY